MILVDTNAWVSHVQAADQRLAGFLRRNQVVVCDVVIGELLLGSGIPPQLRRALADLPAIPCLPVEATRAFIERHPRTFRASGVGWADAQIIHAAAEAGALVYSSDRAVRAVWRSLEFRLP